MKIIKHAHLTCPKCGFIQEVEMPIDSCQFLYKCINCKSLLTPNPGDCCVFCSYADIVCPPKQMEKAL